MYPPTTKILYADDAPAILGYLENELNSMGYTNIVSAVDGQDALDKLQAATITGKPFELVISDWMMPKLSGLEFLKAAKANANIPPVPFLFLTIEADMQKVWQAIDSGVSGYIVKPLVPGILRRKIEEIYVKHKK